MNWLFHLFRNMISSINPYIPITYAVGVIIRMGNRDSQITPKQGGGGGTLNK